MKAIVDFVFHTFRLIGSKMGLKLEDKSSHSFILGFMACTTRCKNSNIIFHFRILLIVVLLVVVLMTCSLDLTEYFDNDKLGQYKNTSVKQPNKLVSYLEDSIDVAEILPNCGIKHECQDDEFAVHIYTGQDKDDHPKLCVGGRYIKGAGRGLNIAVVEGKHYQIRSLRNFDIYSYSSSPLVAWLEQDFNDNDIIIAFTFDEASKELSKNATTKFFNLGSGKIQDLQFRYQWYMISQVGMRGFSPLEEITFGRNFWWGKAIDKRLCVPKKILPFLASQDPYPRKNPLREQLCEVSQELYHDRFCDPMAKHEPFIPSQLTNRSLIGNPAYSTPIIVIAGPSMSTLALTLETLVYQPGIQCSHVLVIHTPKQIYVPVLSKIFGFQSVMMNNSYPVTTNDKIEFGLNFVANNFSTKEYSIVIEEGLILSADFLFYMAQLLPILSHDKTILGISAWNPYGYVGVSGNVHLSYRAEDFPGVGFLLRMSIYHKYMKGKMLTCCSSKSYLGWRSILKMEDRTSNIIIPDVSRVLKRPKDFYLKKRRDTEFTVFTSPRVTNTNLNAWIDEPTGLILENYNRKLQHLVNESINITFTKDDLLLCQNSTDVTTLKIMKELENKTLSVHYQETSLSQEILKAHLKCFNITVQKNEQVQNLYSQVLRLTLKSNQVLLVNNSSLTLY